MFLQGSVPGMDVETTRATPSDRVVISISCHFFGSVMISLLIKRLRYELEGWNVAHFFSYSPCEWVGRLLR